MKIRPGHIDILGGDGHDAALRHRVAGVEHHIHQCELEFVRVDLDRPCGRRHIEDDPDVAADGAHQHFTESRGLLGDRQRRRIEALAARKGQELPGERRAALCGVVNRLGRAHGFRVAVGDFSQRPDVPADDHQQVVEVVRDAPGELPERVHLLCLGELRLHLLPRQLCLAPLGDIAGDLGEADQFAGLVANGVDHHAGPERLPSLRTRQPSASKLPVCAAVASARAGQT